MKVILCLDDNNGMLFNNRRQSRDRLVNEDIISKLSTEKLRISPFSEKLFEEYSDKVIVDEDFLKGESEHIYFVENHGLKGIKGITEIIVYKWNRIYPADFYCDVDFSEFTLVSETEFTGNSHEKITKQIFTKR